MQSDNQCRCQSILSCLTIPRAQVKANAKDYSSPADFAGEVHTLRRGDIIGVEGVPCRVVVAQRYLHLSKLKILGTWISSLSNKSDRSDRRSTEVSVYE